MGSGENDSQKNRLQTNGKKRPWHSLSGKLLLLTVLFVMIAEVLIFVPSVANMRMRWLEDRLRTAAAASLVVEGWENMELPRPIQDDALMATGTKSIALKTGNMSRLIATSDMPPRVDQQYDLSSVSPFAAIRDAFVALFSDDRVIRVYGPVEGSTMMIDVVMEEDPLRNAMLIYGRNVFFLSVLISLFTAGLVFVAINTMMISPIRRMTASMQVFSREPDDPSRIIHPRDVQDEIGIAERHLEAMQKELQGTLKKQQHLANLGLAVSKINHDMRNILASAQLMSDRLSMVDDPVVKRFAPKLIRTVDRAVDYTREVLDYGRASEAEPNRRRVDFAALVEDVRDMLIVDADPDHANENVPIDFIIDVPEGLELDADSEQLFRAIHNLCRNAIQALTADASDDLAIVRRITVSARVENGMATIDIDDTGPGMPPKALENLFRAFHGSTRSGGTGLGLAIANELVRAHGGTIGLVDKSGSGTHFRITLPNQPEQQECHQPLVPLPIKEIGE
ncbi:HAMP domain-containing sensor histidine kinase [Hoeflea prorocentri]|uniref:histidine kinase n=2 Tax=Hoeflea prorocentri TaxID=1922333 RepID=A0A9X3UKX5_9HYPH|nr:HAMP domain-containing sensor histidine kinase [Hoeflea prorocentri]MCY6382703.1 HAMP domain-containing sensor histidine kinase [Hoeflea prorocentri]MDA5400503.1 HAMP domain-containing sensor histidine kinase [Hoeflea prorocentri]